MKKNTLLVQLITIIITVGTAFSSMQIPLCVIAAETAIEEESAEEELTSEPETVASETSAPEKETVEDEPITEATVATDTEKPDSDAKDKSSDESVEKPVENNETPKEEVTPEVTSEGKETPAEGPDKDHDANADDSKDGTEDEIIEEETESVTTREAVYSRATYNDVFATLKGSGYSLSQARNAVSNTFTVGQYMYIWAWLHDANGNLYKSYGSGTPNMMLAIYRPDGSCAHSYTYNNSDNNWIGVRLDKAGTWKIQSKISGSITGNNIQTVTVKQASGSTNNTPTSVRVSNAPGTMNIGDSRTLKAIITPSNATNKGVTWKSSNTSVLTVNSNGKITAKGAGSAKITVKTKANGKTASFTVKVNPYESAKSLPNLNGLGTAEKVARTAESQIGYQGHNKNGTGKGDYTIYGNCVNAVGQQWCAAFVSWVAKASNCKSIPKTAWCKGMADSASRYRRWTASNASKIKRGDIVFFSNKKAKLGNSGHVGVVTSVSYVKKTHKYRITIVEGNTGSDKVSRNTYTASESGGYIGSYWSYIGGYISVK